MPNSVRTLPVLDLARFDKEPAQRDAFLRNVRDAAFGPGFFYLVGHGISDRLIRDVLTASRNFFSLPEADKLSIEMVNSPHFRGYTRAGREFTRGAADWREQLDVGAEREAFPFSRAAPAWTRLQGPNQWPSAQPELKPLLLRYQQEVTALAIKVLRVFAAALDQPEDVFEPIYAPSPHQLIKIIRYPGRAATESDQGVGAHKDSGFVTILLQDSVAGLQVETDDGWIDAPPLPGSFVVNIGEILELASNGTLRANVHRVVSPPAGTDRLSVAFFLGARLDASVPVLQLPPTLAPHARGITQDPKNPLFREVGRNYLKGRLRSHPDVARRHHADLLEDAVNEPDLASAY
ncbi:2-oxoglutarate and iron-dependent oxygenase domain-containing protein [Rhodopseudomonas sp. BR0M22]|uniref:isopenicillin N synthase family dioxygenase n=1 Tax=Rhodopseudomonas sp. BR0M22 TaxID=2269369 RepID=UPI0013DEEA7E|nr:2-oxoglutarate and iron-dependent oxygenase domain-containing protein [Rhodopseudomonas sp. BR0M22]NEW93849.1 isopenicillin N synthase family oxygenase [Rhodopseudomonas sp. BR0M22]